MESRSDPLEKESKLHLEKAIQKLLSIKNAANFIAMEPTKFMKLLRQSLVTYFPDISWAKAKYAVIFSEISEILVMESTKEEKRTALQNALIPIIEAKEIKTAPPVGSIDLRSEMIIAELIMLTRKEISESSVLKILNYYIPEIEWNEVMRKVRPSSKKLESTVLGSITSCLLDKENWKKIPELITQRTQLATSRTGHHRTLGNNSMASHHRME